MPTGAITAYVRVDAGFEPIAVHVLDEAGFDAWRDDGDPRRPVGSVDLYVSRHYGMTNPDARVVERHHAWVLSLLDEVGIAAQSCGGSVERSQQIPAQELYDVVDVRVNLSTGFTVRGRDEQEALAGLAVVAESLGVDPLDYRAARGRAAVIGGVRR
jgi:hypothetical protein